MPATTLLEAINTLLAAIGSSPVTNTDTPQNADAIIAKNNINRALRDIQTEKWYFNSESDYPLTPDVNGTIHIPNNIINIDFTGRLGEGNRFVIRGKKLYDRLNHTFKIDEQLEADVVLCLEYDEIPESAAQYVIAQAARRYQEEMLGDPSLRTWTKQDEDTARGKLLDEDLRMRKVSLGVLPKRDPIYRMGFRNH